LLSVEEPHIAVQGSPSGGIDKIELTVERDDLIGDEDQIELALHMSRNGKDVTSQTLPVIPRFTFSMKQEAEIWRLNEAAVTVRLPLADPTFLKAIEDRQRSQNEQMTKWSIQQVNMAEKSYSAAEGHFACSLSALTAKGQSGGKTYLYDPQLAAGKKNGYVFAISGCDQAHYKVVAEPAVSGSDQRAFCSDEGGAVRASSDGKATTCLSNGETVQEALPERATGMAIGGSSLPADAKPQSAAPSAAPQRQNALVAPAVAAPTQRIRVSQAVMEAMKVYDVAPVNPGDARVQGSVVLEAVIGKNGAVENLHILSTASRLLNQAAIDAAKQRRYRPYLLNGQPVEVDTQITVNFTLSAK
jgi:TonB family protein